MYITSKDLKQPGGSVVVRHSFSSEHYHGSPLDAFIFDKVPVDDGEMIRVTRDVYILLNQKRITSQSLEAAAQAILANVRTGSLSDKFSNLSDSDLLSCIKSRYIQAPCELLDWSAYLESQLGRLESEAAEAIQQQQQQTEPAPPAASE